jgi:protein CrcB
MIYLLVGVGGALGSVARYWMTLAVGRLTGGTFPWHTVAINVIGSGVIGAVAATALAETRAALSPELRVFLMTGVCGGFTTFSAFSLQTMELLRQGRGAEGLANVLLSVVLCVLATALGYAAMGGALRT